MIQKVKTWIESEKIQFQFTEGIHEVRRLRDSQKFFANMDVAYPEQGRSMFWKIYYFYPDLIHVMIHQRKHENGKIKIEKRFVPINHIISAFIEVFPLPDYNLNL